MMLKHIKIARGSAQVRMKLRNVTEGHTIEKTFQAGERFAIARLERREAQFSTATVTSSTSCSPTPLSRNPVSSELLEDVVGYLLEGMTLDVILHGDVPIGVELPTTVDLQVSQTEPGFKGDTAQGGTKPATLETGITVTVPMFVSEEDTIRVDTRSGDYIERV